MALPVFRAAHAGSNITSASPTITAPAGMAVGDFVVCWFGTDSVHTRTVPSGWTALGLTDDGAADTTCSAIGKIADAADVAAGSWTFTNYFAAIENGRGSSACWSGVDQTTPIHAGPAVAAASTAVGKTSPAITTTVADCLGIFLMGADPGADPKTCTATSPAVARLTSQNALLGWIYCQESAIATATVGFTQAATLSAIDGTGNIAFALAPAAGGGAADVPLDTSAAASNATLALTVQTRIPLGTSPAQSNATLALRAPTQVPLQSSPAQSNATLALTAPARVSLGTAAAQSAATLALTAPTQVPLQASAAQSTATLNVTVPAGATVPLDPAVATSTGTLALKAQTQVPLGTAAAQSAATLSLTAQTRIPLGTSAAQSSATLTVFAPSSTIPMQASVAVSNATLALSAQTRIPLGSSVAVSNATLALRAATRIVLQASPASSSATLVVFCPTVAFVPLTVSAAISSTGVLDLSTVAPAPLGHIDGATFITLVEAATATASGIEGATATSSGVESSLAAVGVVD